MTGRPVDGYTRRIINPETSPLPPRVWPQGAFGVTTAVAVSSVMKSNQRQFYTIRLEGRLELRWSEWFDGMTIAHTDAPKVETILSGYVRDQAALHGLLTKIRDLNLPLIAVERRLPAGSDSDRGG